jgi:hypothetical protein
MLMDSALHAMAHSDAFTVVGVPQQGHWTGRKVGHLRDRSVDSKTAGPGFEPDDPRKGGMMSLTRSNKKAAFPKENGLKVGCGARI